MVVYLLIYTKPPSIPQTAILKLQWIDCLKCVWFLRFVLYFGNISETPTILLIGHFTVRHKVASPQTEEEKSLNSFQSANSELAESVWPGSASQHQPGGKYKIVIKIKHSSQDYFTQLSRSQVSQGPSCLHL